MARLKNIIEKSQTVATITTTYYSEAIDITGVSVFSAEIVADVNTPTAKVFTADNATETFTTVAHGYTTGLKGQTTNSGGGLPTGLSAGTDYFVIVVTADTFKLATSLANALAGTNLTISTDGTGTQTFTPTSIAGANVKLQKSNTPSDSLSWVDEGNATNITADGYTFLEKVDPSAKAMRVAFTLTAGSLSATNYILGKGVDG
jgi:hypothetical protein